MHAKEADMEAIKALFAIVVGCVALFFIAAAVSMLSEGDSPEDRWGGATCFGGGALLFGAIAYSLCRKSD